MSCTRELSIFQVINGIETFDHAMVVCVRDHHCKAYSHIMKPDS